MLGLPVSWKEVEEWLGPSRDVVAELPKQPARWEKKNPEIPTLESYAENPPAHFWSKFPKNYPDSLRKQVDIVKLRMYVDICKNTWTLPQRRIAEQAIRQLEGKINAPLGKKLGGLFEKNAPSALENGEFMTDVLAGWV
jgi:hypothetical protein